MTNTIKVTKETSAAFTKAIPLLSKMEKMINEATISPEEHKALVRSYNLLHTVVVNYMRGLSNDSF